MKKISLKPYTIPLPRETDADMRLTLHRLEETLRSNAAELEDTVNAIIEDTTRLDKRADALVQGSVICVDISITTNSTGYYNIVSYPRDEYVILSVLPLLKSDYYAMPTGSVSTNNQWIRVHHGDGTAAASETMTIRLAMIHI